MSSQHEQRIEELIKHGALLLDLYLTGSGGHRSSEPWYTILAAGIDLLTSLSMAAISTGDGKASARDLMIEDANFFLTHLLDEPSPGSPRFTDAIFFTKP